MPVTIKKSGETVGKVAYKKGFASLKSLSFEHQAALDSFLIADHPIDSLVKLIQQEWKELQDSKPSAVRRMLYRYKSKIIHPKQAKLAAKHSSEEGLQILAAQVAHLEQRLDPVMTLESLVIQQSERLQKMAKVESNAPTLLDVQTKNIALMGQLLSQLINTQLEVGVLRRVPKKMAVDIADISDEERRFIESAKLADNHAGFLVEAMRLLKEDGVVDVPSRDVGS